MKKGFSGGIHPAGKKELTGRECPQASLNPELVVIPLRQHIGRECEPLVKVGDAVGRNQKIGDGSGMCIPVHASVSGRVTAIEQRPHPGGGTGLCVVIQNDRQKWEAGELSAHNRPELLSRKEILTIIREAGIVGMGGAAFPTEIKADIEEGIIDTVIVNACECEPYITADDLLLWGYGAEVLGGLTILGRILGAGRLVVAVEDNKQETIESLRRKLPEAVELTVLPTRYPQGAEKLLIRSVTGREVPSGALSREVGCAVFNAATCAAVFAAVVRGRPLTHRIVTVTGEGVASPKNMIVPIGMLLSDVIREAGGMKGNVVKVVCGGPMMGRAQETLDVPVVKGTNAVLCLTKGIAVEEAGGICIRCGKCVEACPVNLQPLYLYRYGTRGDVERLERYHVADCIECGCCAYSCPGKLPIADRIRQGKQKRREAMG